jgi:hypothetical protein
MVSAYTALFKEVSLILFKRRSFCEAVVCLCTGALISNLAAPVGHAATLFLQ